MSNERSPAGSFQNQNHTTRWWAIATFFGAGYLKPGPGTWGSIAAVLL